MIYNHLELVVKMNNMTKTLHNSNYFLHASSVSVSTVHLCMTKSVKDISCKALDFTFNCTLKYNLSKCGGKYFSYTCTCTCIMYMYNFNHLNMINAYCACLDAYC